MLLFKTGSSCLAFKQRRFKRMGKKKGLTLISQEAICERLSLLQGTSPFPHPIHCLQSSCQQKLLAFSHLSVESKVSPHFHTVFITLKCWQTWCWLWEATLTKGKCLLYLPAVLPWSLSPVSLEKAGQTFSEILWGKSLVFRL